MKIYPSSITKEQFKLIEDILENSKKHTRPRKYKLFDIFNAMLYVLKTGCQWAALPGDFPDYKLVHYYFMHWSKEKEGEGSILEIVLKKNDRKFSYKSWKEKYPKPANHRRTEY
jgi:transposase